MCEVIGMVKENEKTTASCCAAARQSVDETPHARVSDSDAIEVPGAVKQPDRLRDMVFIQGDTFLMGTHDKDGLDRKSTRLNSSHVAISYAVFCLKKKKCLVIILLFKSFVKQSGSYSVLRSVSIRKKYYNI